MARKTIDAELAELVQELRRVVLERHDLSARAAAQRARAETLRDLSEMFAMPTDRERLRGLADDAEAFAEKLEAEQAALNR